MDKSEFYNPGVILARNSFFERNQSSYDQIYEIFFKLIIDNTPTGGSILDLGTGNGYVLESLLKRANKKKYRLMGLDLSEDMIRDGLDRNQGKWGLIVGDNFSIPLKSSSLDSVTANNSPNICESEIYRVLKEGGRLFFKEYGLNRGLGEIGSFLRQKGVSTKSPEDFVALLEPMGFRNIQLNKYEIHRTYTFEDMESILKLFPLGCDLMEEDMERIKSLFKSKNRLNLISDPFIITCTK